MFLSGCFELATDTQFQEDGSATVEVEFAVSMQMAAMAAGLAKDGNGDIFGDCGKPDPAATTPDGVKVMKSTRGMRGDMMTCTVVVAVRDPVAAAKTFSPQRDDKGNASKYGGMLEITNFRLERLDAGTYRFVAAVAAPDSPPKVKANPFEAMFTAALLNRYITLSISAARIANTNGELSDSGRRVTFKLPVAVLVKPPPGFGSDMRADIIYSEGWWASFLTKTRRLLGLD